MGELLPCPFCGSAPRVTTREIRCDVCDASGPPYPNGEEAAQWNRRADLGETVQRAWQVAEAARREADELRAERDRLLEQTPIDGTSEGSGPRSPRCRG